MSYRRALVTRWSRRDRLAVLVVAVAVAFLTGVTLLLLAAGAQTASVAAQFDTPGSAMYVAGDVGADQAGVVVPVAVVASNRSDTPVTLVGVPPNATAGEQALRRGDGTTRGTLTTAQSERLAGADGSVSVTVEPRGAATSVFSPDWYVTDPGTVRAVGKTGAFVLRSEAPADVRRGVPLLGALAFFVLGTREAIGTLGAAAAGTTLLVAVTVFSVSRMSVRDRLETIQVVRATGGTGRAVLGLFTLRAGLLTAVGVALGYALGVIVATGAVSLAVAVGAPTALPVRVTGEAVRILAPLYASVVLFGAGAGLLAAYRVATCPPAEVTADPTPAHDREGVLPAWATPRLLRWRALVPTTATLAAFVAIVLLVAGLAGAVGPVVATEDTTITQPGSTHPVSSRVPAAYAPALRSQGIDASGEILLFEVVDGQPFVARGAAFGPFATLSDARLVEGRPHAAAGEAVIGRGLAETLDVGVGESITLGGSTERGLTRLEVVGVFTAPGSADDQLLVGLDTARHLAGVGDGQVQFVRAAGLPDGPANGSESGIEITGLSTDGPVVAGESFTAQATVRNLGLETAATTVTVRYRGMERTQSVAVPATATRTVAVSFPAGAPGSYELTTRNRTTTVSVRDPTALSVSVPPRLPPESEPLVRVTDATGAPVANATVSIENRSRRTDADGTVRLPPIPSGDYNVTVTAGDRTATTAVSVTPDATRELDVTVDLQPAEPTVLDGPTATVRLANEWNRTLTRQLRVAGPGTETGQLVSVPAGETRQVTVSLPQRPPGTYDVAVTANGSTVATRNYEVRGDDRIVAALGASGRTGTTGIGQAAAVAFGNLQVVFGAVLALAGLMTVGGTTATFAQAVHARRRTLGVYRATGATPGRVLRLVVRDAVIVGSVAGALAIGLATAGLLVLAALDYLTVFGVRLAPTLSPAGIGLTLAGSVLLTVVGATVATLGLLQVAPGRLLGTQAVEPPERTDRPE